ncbi:D-arabinono-1,4-lactone oxidase [Rhodococcus sp. NPDC127528]|uniref:D-arabinono-1,4-lactone oxidase n=1 Tax=unclassified Rhodococcus (in: high G+C Gram-positive bacteria) TaxID=192944 RepID=UPI00363EFC67
MGEMTWTNFAGDQVCRPRSIERPASRDGLAEVIERAGRDGDRVRVAGSGHSFNDGVLTDGVLVTLDRMNRVLDVDPSSGLVRCEAGISLGALSAAMWDHGLAFANLGDIDVQSIAGATATGTHGAGIRLPNLSTSLRSIELTLADGTVIEVDADGDPETYRAARVSIGALGVVSAVTLQAVPAFTLEGIDTLEPLDDVLDNLGELADKNDHFGFFVFPHTRFAMTKTWNRTTAEPRPLSKRREWLHDVVMTNYAFWAACRVGRARPGWIPAINRLCASQSGTTHRIDRSYRVFATPRLVPITEMEYAIPSADAAQAVRRVLAVAQESRFDVPVPLEVRFVAPDDAFLSPAGDRETCYIAVHQFEGMEWEPYFREVERVLLEYGGRPHWGKRHFRAADDLRPHFPHWDRFAAVRDRLDPQRRFTNPYVERVLGA